LWIDEIQRRRNGRSNIPFQLINFMQRLTCTGSAS
jgi:hypothetical protein